MFWIGFLAGAVSAAALLIVFGALMAAAAGRDELGELPEFVAGAPISGPVGVVADPTPRTFNADELARLRRFSGPGVRGGG